MPSSYKDLLLRAKGKVTDPSLKSLVDKYSTNSSSITDLPEVEPLNLGLTEEPQLFNNNRQEYVTKNDEPPKLSMDDINRYLFDNRSEYISRPGMPAIDISPPLVNKIGMDVTTSSKNSIPSSNKSGIDYDKMIEEAKATRADNDYRRNMLNTLAMASKGSSDVASTFTGTKVSNTGSDVLSDMAKQIGSDSTSRNKEILDIYKLKQDEQEQKARLNEYKERSKAYAQLKADSALDKKNSEIDKMLIRYTDMFEKPYSARGGSLANAALTIRAGESLDALIAGVTDVTKVQLREMASTADRMVRGGPSSVRTIDELVPKNAKTSWQAAMDWASSEPNGIDQRKYLKILKSMVDRERPVAEAAIMDHDARVASLAPQGVYEHPIFQAKLANSNILEHVEKLRKGEQVPKLTQQSITDLRNKKSQTGTSDSIGKVKMLNIKGEVKLVPSASVKEALENQWKLI